MRRHPSLSGVNANIDPIDSGATDRGGVVFLAGVLSMNVRSWVVVIPCGKGPVARVFATVMPREPFDLRAAILEIFWSDGVVHRIQRPTVANASSPQVQVV